MVYPTLSIIAVSSSLAITKNRDVSFNCPAKIDAFSVVFPVFRLTPVKAVDRFSAVYSALTNSHV
jgi:hypothetical protein